jgi:hypothetical protein
LSSRRPSTLLIGLQAAAGVGDEHAVEGAVDVALGQGPGAGFLQPGLHAGEATEPHQVEIAGAERGHGGGVVGDGDELHRHLQLLGQFIGHQAVEPVELFGVLVGDGTDAQHPLGVGLQRLRRWVRSRCLAIGGVGTGRWQQAQQQQAGERNGPTFSNDHLWQNKQPTDRPTGRALEAGQETLQAFQSIAEGGR